MITNAFDLFISETAVSNRHGLGITLQRILGDEIYSIKRYVHFGPFAKMHPAVERIQRRCRYFYGPLDLDIIGPMMTGRLGGWCRDTRLEQWMHSSLAAFRTAQMFPAGRPLSALVCPQGIISLLTLEALKRNREVRYITWLMDDQLLRFEAGKWGYPEWIAKVMHRHLTDATCVIAISQVQADYYEQAFGVRSEVLFGPGDSVGEPVYQNPSNDGPLKVGYFGSIWQWQHDAMVKFARALRPDKEELHVFSLHSSLPRDLQLPAVKLMDPVPMAQMAAKMREYDAVLIPIGFHESQRKFSEFNIATKMSECLASGTLTIVVGPPYAAMVRYLQDTGAACVLTDEAMTQWPKVAESLRNSADRKQMLDAAHKLVQNGLTTDATRAKWNRIAGKLFATT